MTYGSIVTASTVIDHFIIELSTLMGAEKSSAPIGAWDSLSAMARIIMSTGFDLINREIEYHSYGSIECDYQPEKLQWTKRVAGKDHDNHKYRIQPYQRDKSNIIPTSQFSVIISRRTYNPSRDPTPQSAIPRTEVDVIGWLWVSSSCIPTTLATSKKPGGQRKQQRQLGESQNGGDMKCNLWPFICEPAENTSGNSNNANNTGNSKSLKINKPSGGSRANYIQQCGFQSKSTKAERQTSNALAAAAEITVPYLQPWMRHNRTESP